MTDVGWWEIWWLAMGGASGAYAGWTLTKFLDEAVGEFIWAFRQAWREKRK